MKMLAASLAAAMLTLIVGVSIGDAQTPSPTKLTTATAVAGDPFPKPAVAVVVSSLAAGAHGDIQTTIDTPAGLTFDQVTVSSAAGSRVAADAEIADGTVVGRLDSDSTTNAITGAVCNVHVSSTVPIREETADIAAPDYPAYLRTVVPGRHRLRLVADVSPSPEVTILVNYLFDIDPQTDGVVLRTVIGDPTAAPSQLQTCTPQKSTNTLFGVTPSGAPLFTSPHTPPPRPLVFVFNSRPDPQGLRHTQTVRVTATEGAITHPPLVEPTPAANVTAVGGPHDLALRETDAGVALVWADDGAERFDVGVIVQEPSGEGHSILHPLSIAGHELLLPPEWVPDCARPGLITYRVSREGAADGDFVELGGGDQAALCHGNARGQAVTAPEAGTGPGSGNGVADVIGLSLILLVGGAWALLTGVRRWSASGR